MRSRAGGGLREAVLAGIRLHQLDQLLERRCRKAGVDRNHVGRGSHQSDRRKVLDRVIGNFRIHARIDHEPGAHHEHGVAVGRRMRRRGHAGVAAGAGHVFDVDLLP